METVYSKVTVFAPAMLAHAFGAAVAFVVCMMLDIPRRGLLKLCSRLAGETLKKLDALYASLSGRFEKTFAGD